MPGNQVYIAQLLLNDLGLIYSVVIKAFIVESQTCGIKA